MDTQTLIETLTREVLKEIAVREKNVQSDTEQKVSDNGIVTAFIGNDQVLKDELKKETVIFDNIKPDSSWEDIGSSNSKKRLVVSSLCINGLIDLSQGRKSIITEYLFNEGEVILVEEGLEYKKYSEPSALIKLYDEYLEKVKKFGIKVVKRTEVKDMLSIKEKVYMEGLITESKLRTLGIKNQTLVVKDKSKITSLAMDYKRKQY